MGRSASGPQVEDPPVTVNSRCYVAAVEEPRRRALLGELAWRAGLDEPFATGAVDTPDRARRLDYSLTRSEEAPSTIRADEAAGTYAGTAEVRR